MYWLTHHTKTTTLIKHSWILLQTRIIYGAGNVPGGATEEEKKAAREKYAAGPLRTILGMYEERLKRTTGPFLLGQQISLADLWGYFVVGTILQGAVRVGPWKHYRGVVYVLRQFHEIICELGAAPYPPTPPNPCSSIMWTRTYQKHSQASWPTWKLFIRVRLFKHIYKRTRVHINFTIIQNWSKKLCYWVPVWYNLYQSMLSLLN